MSARCYWKRLLHPGRRTKLRADREFILAAVAQNVHALYNVPERPQADQEFILAAVAQEGIALQYASNELKKDR